eukprot:m.87294 g.87294  ORF g.87294 m.87294 type:complete len:1189 (+) comp8787_c0_seq3:100-3666(+)
MIVAPVTALHVEDVASSGRVMFAGCGPYVIINKRENRKVLKVGSVSGIVTFRKASTQDEMLLLCYGGKELVIVNGFGDVKAHHFIKDRIWAASALPVESTGLKHCFGLVLAHNSFHIWGGDTLSELKEVRHFQGDVACLLYSAAIFCYEDHIVFASGTIFQQVRLCSLAFKAIGRVCCNEEESTARKAQILPSSYVLSGHDGVIFNVRFSPSGHKLLSLSDDRSARVWNLNFPTTTTTTNDGYEEKSDDPTVLSSVLTLYGHSSRVWIGLMLKDLVVTAGEDGIVCVWDFEGNRLRRYKGHIGRGIWSAAQYDDNSVVTGGGDGSVWKWDTSLASIEKEPIVTGSWMPPPPSENHEESNMPTVCCLLASQTFLSVTLQGEVFTYCMKNGTQTFLFQHSCLHRCVEVARTQNSKGNIVALTSTNGVVFICNEHACLGAFRAHVSQIRSLYWIGHGVKEQQRILLTCSSGELRIWNVAHDNDTITSVQLLGEIIVSADSYVQCATKVGVKQLLAIGDRKGFVRVYRIPKHPSDELEDVVVFPVTELDSGDTKLFDMGGIQADNERMIYAKRDFHQKQHGKQEKLKLNQATTHGSNSEAQPLSQLSTNLVNDEGVARVLTECVAIKAHGKQSVTSVGVFRSVGDGKPCLISTGRNGYYCVLRLDSTVADEDRFGVVLNLVGKQKVNNKMGWLQNILLAETQHNQMLDESDRTGNDEDFLFTNEDAEDDNEENDHDERDSLSVVDVAAPVSTTIGFMKKDFVVLDSISGQEIVRLDIGGGHRSCDFFATNNDASAYSFAFVRQGSVNWQQSAAKATEVDASLSDGRTCLIPGFHGREVIALELLKRKVDGKAVVLCGSEDTTWSISSLEEEEEKEVGQNKGPLLLKKHNRLHHHMSAVRALASCEISSPTASSSATVVFSGCGAGLVTAWSFNAFTQEYGALAYTAQVVSQWPPSQDGEEIHARVMCIDAISTDDEMMLAVALSDGSIRLISFVDGKFYDRAQTQNQNKCVLGCSWVLGLFPTAVLLSAATSGKITFWKEAFETRKEEEEVIPLFELEAHQSGVNDYCTAMNANKLFIVSGGDDNAVTLSVLSLKKDTGELTLVHQETIPNAHSTAVTTCVVCKNDNAILVATSGADSRVNVWTVDVTSYSIKLTSAYITGIHDVHRLACIRKEPLALLVAGKGIEILDINE